MESKKIVVPNGWVKVRDPKMVPERLRRPIMARASGMQSTVQELVNQGVPLTEEVVAAANVDVTQMYEFSDLLIVALISEWSFGEVINVETVLDLPVATYDKLQSLVSDMVIDLMPSFEPDPSEDSPTALSVT